MGRGPTQTVILAAKRRLLSSYKRQLVAAGVKVLPLPAGLANDPADVHDIYGSDASPLIKFRVMLKDTLHASNGEAALNPEITISAPLEAGGKNEVYGLVQIGLGIERIKAIFGNAKHREALPESNLAALVVQVERAVMKMCNTLPGNREEADTVFLYDAANKRIGEVYAYNEMKNGKPMIRVGNPAGSSYYVELSPGFSVRYGDVRIIVER